MYFAYLLLKCWNSDKIYGASLEDWKGVTERDLGLASRELLAMTST
jgi:hypothetical protein